MNTVIPLFRNSTVIRAVAIPLTLLSFLSACTKWVPIEGPVSQYITEKEPGNVRVTLPGDTVVHIREPHVQGDTLVGLDANKYRSDSVSVLLPRAIKVEARVANTGNTIVLGVSMALLVGGIIALSIGLSNSFQ